MFWASAQVTTDSAVVTTHKYYYYPSSNVYFDEASGNYWYLDNTTSQWSMVQALPSTITVETIERQPIDYVGDDPWRNNADDIKKYKMKEDKTKIKSDDDKAKMKDDKTKMKSDDEKTKMKDDKTKIKSN